MPVMEIVKSQISVTGQNAIHLFLATLQGSEDGWGGWENGE